MLVFLYILGILFFLLTIVLLTQIRIRIENFSLANFEKEKTGTKKNFKVIFELSFLGKIKYYSKNLNHTKIREKLKKQKLEEIDLEKAKQYLPKKKEWLIILKQIKIEQFKLSLKIGTGDVFLTTMMIPILCSLLSSILLYVSQGQAKEQFFYRVDPLYQEEYQYKIKFDSIINIKIVHIIFIIYIILKRRVEKDGRTSYRKPYDFSYEQH